MKWGNSFIFVFLLHFVEHMGCKRVGKHLDGTSFGILDNLIKGALEMLRPGLIELYVKHQEFITGSQEFGDFSGNVNELFIEGLEKFNVTVLKTSNLDINNLTIQDTFAVRGLYNVNGNLAFPLGKNDIHLFGEGEFSAKFCNFTISLKMKIRSNNGTNIIKDFDIAMKIDKLVVYFRELMGGGDLERVFNQIINDVGLTIFNYYKGPLINIVKPEISKFITNLLNKLDLLERINHDGQSF